MAYSRGANFSTKDQDNDTSDARNCAESFEENGLYHHGPHKSKGDGINWKEWKGDYYSAERSEMKIRPADF